MYWVVTREARFKRFRLIKDGSSSQPLNVKQVNPAEKVSRNIEIVRSKDFLKHAARVMTARNLRPQ